MFLTSMQLLQLFLAFPFFPSPLLKDFEIDPCVPSNAYDVAVRPSVLVTVKC